MLDYFFDLFPELLGNHIKALINEYSIAPKYVTEIRLRINTPIYISYLNKYDNKDAKTDKETEDRVLGEIIDESYFVTGKDIKELLDRLTDYSLYAFEDELRQGFITIKGGHRVGLAGQAVLNGGRIMNLKNISFLNIRIAHQIVGCGMQVIPYILCNGRLMDTLIISPPGCGKTTLLRDIVRIISDGNEYKQGMNVGIVDERSEIAGSYMGEPQLDVGRKTDILDACPKADGMLMLLRSMNPEVIAVDEIGSREDIDAINYVSNCGCGILATVHGESIDDIRTRPILRKLVEEKVFERYIVLSKRRGIGTVESVFDERGNELFYMDMCVAQ